MTLVLPPAPRIIEVWSVRSRSWWRARQPRERMLLTGLTVLVGLALIFNGVWGPLRDARRDAHLQIRLYDDLAVRLRAAGPALTPPSSAIRSGSVQAVVTATAAEATLSIREIEQQGAVTVVAMDGVEFGAVMVWLERLEREQGVSVTRADIERQIAPGLVNVRLSLTRP